MNGSMCGLGCQRTLRAPVNASASAGASVHQRCWAWLCSACVTKSQRRALQGWPACAACNPTPTHSTPACDAEVGQITDHGCNNHTLRPSTSAASMQATNYQYQPQMTVAFPGICNGGAGIEMAQTEFRGSQRGCYQDGDWGYLYYHVLVAR